jgi:hypothetical protein
LELIVGNPPLVEVTVGGVTHQQLFVCAIVVELAVTDQLNVRPIRAEVDAAELILRVDPPFIEVMIDRILHQNLAAAVGAEVAGGDELHVGPIGAEIDPLQRVVEIDPPLVEMMVDGVGYQKTVEAQRLQ